jgi:hypothetical protein
VFDRASEDSTLLTGLAISGIVPDFNVLVRSREDAGPELHPDVPDDRFEVSAELLEP